MQRKITDLDSETWDTVFDSSDTGCTLFPKCLLFLEYIF